jgi:primary-amine oxidase
MDAVFGSDIGPAEDSPTGTYDSDDTIGIYERDHGLLWTRTDPSTAERDTRGRRDLVVTWNAWIGNYIYGFDWIFGMDGTIEVKVVLTGTTLNRGSGGEDEVGAPLVGVDENGVRVSAPNHQHFFSFRLDLDIDGAQNTVAESDVRHIPTPGFKNAFGAEETELTMEGFRDADPSRARHWEVSSATAENALGKHTSYAIETRDHAVPLSAPDYEPLLRAAFASHAFWVTRFHDDERYAAGDFPNQGLAGAGLQSFVTPPESIGGDAGADVVVWQTIGMTHVPRPEDYPVMPTESLGFKIVPHGFFDRNPALDAQELPQARPRTRAVRPR